jgi:hypothetical protein
MKVILFKMTSILAFALVALYHLLSFHFDSSSGTGEQSPYPCSF